MLLCKYYVAFFIFSLAAGLYQSGFITTHGGNLLCSKIIHLITNNQVKSQVSKVLHECEQRMYKSVAFPAIGTGLCFLGKAMCDGVVQKQANLIWLTAYLHKNCSLICALYFCLGQAGQSSAKVADEMLDAVVEFARQKSVQHLQTIKIVIFQTNMLTDFYESMKKREDSDSSTKESWLSVFQCKLVCFLCAWANKIEVLLLTTNNSHIYLQPFLGAENNLLRRKSS